MKVYKILENKKKILIFITSTITVYEALKIMGENNIGALLVIEDGSLKGIISERDYARKIALQGKRSHDTLVAEIMTKSLYTVGLQDTIETCMELMRDKHIRHLPVL